MIKWDKLIANCRLGLEDRRIQEADDIRSTFQRDYDRIIFSSPFRRLQDKTQVFPLPGSIFVHNRLTHSLEVASVGRSLGNLVTAAIKSEQEADFQNITGEIGAIVSAACLAHDLGNPPFGHAGESAIADFFKSGGGSKYKHEVTEAQWADFTCFEGNANAFRVLSHQFSGKRNGGFALTYSTLASIVKYPFESSLAGGKPKFGFFQSEKELFRKIASQLDMVKISDSPLQYMRHPLVYLVEAADDICYQIMDVEDAHKLKILTYSETESLFLNFFHAEEDRQLLENIAANLELVSDCNERIAYLRAMVIGKLTKECAALFISRIDEFSHAEKIVSLFHSLPEPSKSAMALIRSVSQKKIYNDRAVIEIEIAGYKILGTLLETFISAVIEPNDFLSKKLLMLIPSQYQNSDDSMYGKIQSVIDFVSGMTDLFALDLYRKITGMELPGIA
ncbi:MAG: deoxyguanosinetriphosphate triphosphohydrolase [Bacteroidia bacterium]|nr:deoxyguanosinetriphosphate triphosphohydrolase [Bacteroidia bacterium]